MSLRSRSPLRFRHFFVTFPHERVVQVTLNRPDKLNCIDKTTSGEIQKIWESLDEDEGLWVGIITGVGRAFCTGADLHGTYKGQRPRRSQPAPLSLEPRSLSGDTHQTGITDDTTYRRMEQDERERGHQ